MVDAQSNPWLLRLRVDATPFEDDPPFASRWYQALGLYLVAWGRFEGQFVSALLQLRALGWDAVPMGAMPIAWGKRCDFWKKAFRDLPQLAPIKTDADALIVDIKLAARDRGILVHSMWGNWVPTTPLESISLKFEGESEFAAGNFAISRHRLNELLLVANTLNARLIPISEFLGCLRPQPENAQPILRPKEALTTHPRAAKRRSKTPHPSHTQK